MTERRGRLPLGAGAALGAGGVGNLSRGRGGPVRAGVAHPARDRRPDAGLGSSARTLVQS